MGGARLTAPRSAVWTTTGELPSSYTSRQGSVIGREGRVRLEAVDTQVWVSGDAVTRIVGEVDL